MPADIKKLHKEFMRVQKYTEKKSRETLRGYEASFSLLMKRFTDLTPEKINFDLLTHFFEWLEKRERKVGRGDIRVGVKKSTIATYWNKLNTFLEWLKNEGYIEENPLKNRRGSYPEVKYEDKKYLEKEKLDKIFSAIGFHIEWSDLLVKKRNLAIFTTLFYTGIRKGELLGLQVSDINLEKLTLTVRPETSKSRRRRVLPISPRLAECLEDYINERKRLRYRTNHFWVSGNVDQGLTAHGLKHIVDYICAESGVKFHLHQFRHTFAVNYLNQSNRDIFSLRHFLGHKDIRTTAAYNRCVPIDGARDVISKIDLDTAL